jgi:hypothetical protein
MYVVVITHPSAVTPNTTCTRACRTGAATVANVKATVGEAADAAAMVAKTQAEHDLLHTLKLAGLDPAGAAAYVSDAEQAARQEVETITVHQFYSKLGARGGTILNPYPNPNPNPNPNPTPTLTLTLTRQ